MDNDDRKVMSLASGVRRKNVDQSLIHLDDNKVIQPHKTLEHQSITQQDKWGNWLTHVHLEK